MALPLGPRCKVQYCWLCLADYREIHRIGNEAHQQGCRYHSNRLPDADNRIPIPLEAADYIPEQAARARLATPDSLDMELERAMEGGFAAALQADEDMNNGIEQDPQVRRIELPHRSRDRRTSRPVKRASIPVGVSEKATEDMTDAIEQDSQARPIELPHSGLRNRQTARVAKNTSGPVAASDGKRSSRFRLWRK